MDELLQKLFEAEVLSEDTRKELEEAMQSKLNEAVEQAKKEAAADVRAELTEQWVQERDALIEAVDSKVDEYLSNELSELKGDIENFRDLEAEAAQNLVEAKAQMADELKGDLAELVEKLDAFLEIRLSAEMEELREDLQEVRKNEFGRKIVEAFAEEFRSFVDADEEGETLAETRQRLNDTESTLAETEEKLADLERTIKMEKVLSPLSGRSKEVMEAILRNVPTGQLEEGYKTFIGRVLKEADNSEKEDKVLAEGKTGDKKTITESDGDVVSGDNEDLIAEREKEDSVRLTEGTRARLRKLAGLDE